MDRRGYAKTIGLVIVAVVVIGFVWYAAVAPSIGWPVEARRVVHPGGFSVVQPFGWEMHQSQATDAKSYDGIRFLPEKSVGAPGSFSVTRIGTTETEDDFYKKKYAATTFEGQPAFERWSFIDQTREHSRSLIFRRDGCWYDMSIRRPKTESITDGIWLKYLESFRVEPRAATKPAATVDLITPAARPSTQPTSAPTP